MTIMGRHNTPAAWLRNCKPGTPFIIIALLNTAIVAVTAFSGSWQHQYELSVHLGQAHWVAGMQPLSVEGLIAAASLVMWYAGSHGYRRRAAWGAYAALAAGVGQTVLMNLGTDYQWPWLGPEISVWPAVAFVAAYEMTVWLVRKRQETTARSGTSDRHDSGDTKAAARETVTPAAATPHANGSSATRKPTNAELADAAGISLSKFYRHQREQRERAKNGTARPA